MEVAVVFFGPEMVATDAIDQLSGDANPLARLAHAAFKDVTGAKFLRHLAHIRRFALVGKGRISRNDGERAPGCQGGDDVLGQPVAEILLFRVAAHVGEGQHGDGGLVVDRIAAPVRLGLGRAGAGGDPVGVDRLRNVLDLLRA